MRIRRHSVGVAANRLLKPFGLELRRRDSYALGYISFKATSDAARSAGKSLPEYIRGLWGEEQPSQIAACMDELIDLNSCKHVLEIGPGTGAYHNAIAKRCSPNCEFEFYETDKEWGDYLGATYGATIRVADGRTLDQTPDEVCDLVHAHYIFVCLPTATTFSYFKEMARVNKNGGWIVFDTYLDSDCDLARVKDLMKDNNSYFVVLPNDLTVAFFKEQGVELVSTAAMLRRTYLIFQKRLVNAPAERQA